MAGKVILGFVLLCQGVTVLATLINPQHLSGKSLPQVHCLDSNKPIQIKDPFDHRLIEDKKFIAMEWYQLVSSSSDQAAKETLLIQFLPNKTNVFGERFSVFDFWGIQIHSVGLEDSATYKAKLVHLSKRQDWAVNIVVSTPPVLKSEKLSVSKIVSEDGQSVTLSCGHLVSLGSPPVPLVWKTKNGSVLPAADYKNGYIKLTIPSNEDAGKYSCHLNMSSLAASCILETDSSRFVAVLASSSRAESADVTGIIIGVVVVAVVVIFIIIAVVVFMKRRRQSKSESYNAREQEKRHDAELGRANGVSLLKEEGEDPHGKSRRPISKGVVSADSFMISKMSEGSSDLIFKKINPQTASAKNTGYLNGDKSDLNGHRSQPQQKSTRDVEPDGDKSKQKTESNKKKSGKLEANGLKGKEQKPHKGQPKSALKHTNGIYVNGIIGNGKVSNGTTGNGMVGNGMVGTGMAGNGMVGNGMVGNGMVGNDMVGNGTAGNGMVGNGTAGNGMIGNGTVGNGMAGNGMVGTGMVGNGTAGSGMVGNGTVGSCMVGNGIILSHGTLV